MHQTLWPLTVRRYVGPRRLRRMSRAPSPIPLFGARLVKVSHVPTAETCLEFPVVGNQYTVPHNGKYGGKCLVRALTTIRMLFATYLR